MNSNRRQKQYWSVYGRIFWVINQYGIILVIFHLSETIAYRNDIPISVVRTSMPFSSSCLRMMNAILSGLISPWVLTDTSCYSCYTYDFNVGELQLKCDGNFGLISVILLVGTTSLLALFNTFLKIRSSFCLRQLSVRIESVSNWLKKTIRATSSIESDCTLAAASVPGGSGS